MKEIKLSQINGGEEVGGEGGERKYKTETKKRDREGGKRQEAAQVSF